MPLLWWILLFHVLCTAHGQGLRPDLDALARSGSTYATFSQAYKASTAWRNAMRTSKQSACSMNRGSLCGSTSEEAALLLATAPQAHDSRSKFGDVQVVGPVKDQGGCGMCVAFAVLAAAQTAAAMALRQSIADVTFSEQDFYMCDTADKFQERGCSSGWSLREGMRAFAQLQRDKQLPVVEACRPYEPFSSTPCSRTCTTTLPQLYEGLFKFKALGNIVDMQRHIRHQGSIVCRMQLYSDIKPFFAANPGAVYKGPGRGAVTEDAHAVQVVGYDNNRQAWLIKNSWGPGFAAKGFAWMAFDAPGMCDRLDTYGFTFIPEQPQPTDVLQLAPAPGRKDCHTYKALAGDYPEGVATRAGLTVQQVLRDNLGAIKDPSSIPAGTTLLLCGMNPATVASAASALEVGALLAIKRVLDPPGTALSTWQPGSPSPCGWTGVKCDASSSHVTAIDLVDAKLSGRLPSGALLRRLPALVSFVGIRTGIGGPLPEDWSQLSQLEVVNLSENQLTGTLPPSWGALTKLKVCRLWRNKLSGPLLDRWSGMVMLEELDLSTNALTGTLPPSWAALTKLRIFYVYYTKLSGTLPAAYSAWAALEELALSGNALTGTLPPSWGAHAKLRVSRLWNNKLSGPLPASWSEMAAIEDLQMSANNLAGTVPPSWGSWGRVKTVALWDNPQLSGCLPAAWRRKVNIGSVVGTAGPYKGQDLLTAGTGITGFC